MCEAFRAHGTAALPMTDQLGSPVEIGNLILATDAVALATGSAVALAVMETRSEVVCSEAETKDDAGGHRYAQLTRF